MTFYSKALRSVAAAAVLALSFGVAEAKEFNIAVGDGAGGTQEASSPSSRRLRKRPAAPTPPSCS